MVGNMDEEAIKRLERKIDYLAGIFIGVLGGGVALIVLEYNTWGGWSEWAAVGAVLILPAYLLSKYRDI